MEENLEHRDWMKGIKETGFTAPSNYFDELNESIRARLVTERLKAVVPADGFAVPEGYFDQLNATVLTKTSGKKATESKIVRLWRSNVLKYASAACFVIIAGLGVYFNNEQQLVVRQSVRADLAAEQMLFDIDEDVIIEHIEANYKEEKQSASDAELENYILNNYSQSDLTGIL